MVETLVVVAIGLLALTLRRLGVLLRREEEIHASEARLEDRLRSGMEETARTVQEELAATAARLGDSLLAQLAQTRLALEQKLEALAKQVADANRSSGKALDAIALRTGEEVPSTRRDLLEALATLQPSLDEALGEMRALHEQAVRELRGPIRHAVAIRQEIQRARDQLGRQSLEAPLERPAVSEAAQVEHEVDQILGLELAEVGPPPLEAALREPFEAQPSHAQPPVADPRTGRLAGLLSRVQRRARHTASARANTRVGH